MGLNTHDLSPEEPFVPGKIPIPIVNGFEFLSPDDIVMFKGAGNQSEIHLVGCQIPLIASKTLKAMEELLAQHDLKFFRFHDSYLVNRLHIKRFLKEDGGKLILTDNKDAYIGKAQRKHVDEWLKAAKG
jgi:two-component system, LytTR family, response regulator